jgi:hypothetical protein
MIVDGTSRRASLPRCTDSRTTGPGCQLLERWQRHLLLLRRH